MKLQGSEEREALEGRNSIVDQPGRAGRFRDTLSNFSLEDKIRLVGFTNDTTRMLRNAARCWLAGPLTPNTNAQCAAMMKRPYEPRDSARWRC